ncbi:hypothetical protein VC83_08387 [Pseudogymnoascus destructans]|uniref:Uncharacterized protein n=2 Tax=Pseudogymnoascus destructans TaxID=655981 RepID=L8FX39_PSED2|nr:uncharacterized protein VC83_08387 [Pseudogymnoascus destructans]ELR05079.1 hypothetical protein GMDG_07121 [Pseudogymnoascus destructans 20631-21]OAF55386.1 hypothetical protein VC83_08387 [Pseudogymnoascus destructans]
MRSNVLSTLGVFTTFCQPVSSCVYGTSLLPRADGSLEGSQFGYTDPIEQLQWSQLIPDADVSEFLDVGATMDMLALGTATKSNVLWQFDDIFTENRVVGQYFSKWNHFEFDTAVSSIAFLTSLSKRYSTQVFDTALSPVSHIAELGQIATATAEHSSFSSPISHPDSNPIMSFSGSLTTPSCSEGVVDGVTSVAPITAGNSANRQISRKVMRFNTLHIQGKFGKPSLLLQVSKT